MAIDPSSLAGLVQKVWFELCMFFCRRCRENQRELTSQLFEGRLDEADSIYFFALLLKRF